MHYKLCTLIFSAVAFVSTASAAPVPQKGVDDLNELLRGQRAAVETYQQALEKVGHEPGASELRAALQNHQNAVATTVQEIVRLGGLPATSSGTWGAWAEAVTGGATLLGNEAALKVLKEGEEHGIKEYKEIIANDDISASFKDQVKQNFLPEQARHVAALERMMTGIS